MPALNKLISGLILDETFTKNSMIWTPSPEGFNGFYFSSKGMRMVYTKTYKTYTIQEPQEDYMFSCKIDHVPLNAKDICGVIVMRDNEDYIECQSYIAKRHSYVTNLDTNNQEIAQTVNNIIDGLNLDRFVTYQVDDGKEVWPNQKEWDTPPSTGTTSGSKNDTFEDVLYSYIRVVKKNNIYTFFASTDGKKWIEVGNSALSDSHRIGFFMHELGDDMCEYDNGVLTEKGSHFYVKNAQFYAGNLISIRNVPADATVQLVQGSTIITETGRNNVSRVDNDIFIDATTIYDRTLWSSPQLRLLTGGKAYYYTNFAIYPGDIYEFSYKILVSINGMTIPQDKLFMLDGFYDHDQVIRIDFLNQEEVTLKNIHVRISAYSVYYEGNETLGISLYDENEIEYNFNNKVVTIDEMKPSEGKSVMIKLTDKIIQDYYKKEGQYRFKLDIY